MLVRKEDGKTQTKCIPLTKTTERRVLIKPQNSEMYFADAVILVEGADKYILEAVARNMAEKFIQASGEVLEPDWLDRANISVIACGGKNELKTYRWILMSLGIPSIAIADFDFLQLGIEQYIRGTQAPEVICLKAKELMQGVMQERRRLFAESPNGKDVTAMIDAVTGHLKKEWPIVDNTEWKERLERKLNGVPSIKNFSEVPESFKKSVNTFILEMLEHDICILS